MKRTLKELLYLQIAATVNFIIIMAFAELYDKEIGWGAFPLISGAYIGCYYLIFYFLYPIAKKVLQ